MKKCCLILLGFLLFFMNKTIAQDTLYKCNFDTLTVGNHLAQEAGFPWTTWSNAPGGSEDPLISNTHSSSPSNSIVIEGTNDAVLLLGDSITGRYAISLNVFIPSGFIGYFNILQDFNGSNSIWGTQVYFDAGGVGSVDGGGAGTGSFTYNYDQWIPVLAIIDLNTDWAEIYINNSLVVDWQWSIEVNGSTGQKKLDAMNFYAWTGDSEGTPRAYYDDILFQTALVPEPPQNLQAQLNDINVSLTWEPPTTSTPTSYSVYRNGVAIASGLTTTSYEDADLFPGTYNYTVKAAYPTGMSPDAGPVQIIVGGGIERDVVLVEIATGTWCGYCPGSAMGADDLIANGHEAAIIEYHNGDDFTTTESDARIDYYNVTGFPTAVFDGLYPVVGGSASVSSYPTYFPIVEGRDSIPSIIDLEVLIDSVDELTINAIVMIEQINNNYQLSDLKLQLALIESEIQYPWQGQSELNFVCRDMIPDQNGTSLDFSIQNQFIDTISINIPVEAVKEHCELIAFVQSDDTKEVFQTIKTNLDETVGIKEITETNKVKMRPNPASDYIEITSSNRIKKVIIYNNSGQNVMEVITDNERISLDINHLNTGIYILEITTENGINVSKLIVK